MRVPRLLLQASSPAGQLVMSQAVRMFVGVPGVQDEQELYVVSLVA
jgi:hypothetical protein